MVITMNKKEFVRQLSLELGYSEEVCLIVNNILESNFFISKKSKDKIVSELVAQLEINSLEAERVYGAAVGIIKRELKEKIKHPFGE